MGIASEQRDVLLYPFERGDLVQETQVRDAVGQVSEAFGTHPVVYRHADNAVAREPAPVVEGCRPGGMELEHTACDPDHHGQPPPAEIRRPDIECQTVLTCVDQLCKGLGYAWRVSHLGRLRTKGERLARAVPPLDRPRRQQSVDPKGRDGVGNAFERGNAFAKASSQLATPGFDNDMHPRHLPLGRRRVELLARARKVLCAGSIAARRRAMRRAAKAIKSMIPMNQQAFMCWPSSIPNGIEARSRKE